MRRLSFSALLGLILVAACGDRTEVVEAPEVREASHIMKRGENLEHVLEGLSIFASRAQIISSLQQAGFPFNKCLPGDSVHVVIIDNNFANLTYWQSIQTAYYVEKKEPHLFISMMYPYFDTVAAFITGSINSTLYESMLESGETSNLVIRFADIFAWEIDFFTDTQHGDSFYLYVKKIYCDSTFIDYGFISFAHYKGEVGDYYGFYFRDPDGSEDYYNMDGQSLRKSLLKSPLRFSYISSNFSKSRYHPILKRWRPHHGLDYVAPIGTPIASIGDGKVIFKGWKGGYGNLVEIRHNNNFSSRYGHLSRFAKNLYVGKRVKSGDLIGYLGSTGLSTGPHLHFELHRNGSPINPMKVNIPRAPSVKKQYMDLFEAHRDSVLDHIGAMATDEGQAVPEM